jgi:hypothetical protein
MHYTDRHSAATATQQYDTQYYLLRITRDACGAAAAAAAAPPLQRWAAAAPQPTARFFCLYFF